MKESQPVSEKRPNWIKRLGIAGGAGIVLVIAAFLFATSGTFVKSFVLPQISAALNAKITVAEASVHPFSGVQLKQLQVETDGEPLVKTASASMKYSFFDLLSGRIRVGEFRLEKPEVYVVVRKDGTSNLDPITKAMQANAATAGPSEPASGGAGKIDLAISDIALKDARFRFEQFTKTGLRNLFEADQVNIEIDRFGSGLEGNLKMSTRLKHESGAASLAPTNKLGATVSSAMKFAFDASLMPVSVNGSGALDVVEAVGSLSDVSRLAGRLTVDLTATELRELTLAFKRGEEGLGRVAVSGPFNAATLAARLNVEVAGIGSSVLNLAGAPLGIGFGETMVNTSHAITLGEGAKTIEATGKVGVARLSVRQGQMVTPAMDVDLDYAVAFNQTSGVVDLGRFQMTGKDPAGEFLQVSLSQPLKLTLSDGGVTPGSAAALAVVLNQFDLAKWSPLAGGMLDAGKVDAKVTLNSAADAGQIEVTVEETLRGFATRIGTNRLAGVDVDTAIKLKLTDRKKLAVDSVNVGVRHGGQRLLAVNSAGDVDIETQNANLGFSVLVDLPVAAGVMPLPDVKVEAGNLSVAGRLVSTNAEQQVTGKITLNALSGLLAGTRLDRFGLESGLAVGRAKAGQLKLTELNGALQLAGAAAGRFAVTGDFDPGTGKGAGSVAVSEVDQTLLRQFVEPALGGAKLASIGVDMKLDATYGGGANAALRGNVNVANLVLQDPQGRYPATPLGLDTVVDASLTDGTGGLTVKVPVLRGDVKVGGQKGGHFDVTADFDAAAQNGRFALRVAGINEQLLAPFAGGALGDKSLKSLAVNAKLDGTLDLNKSSSVKGNFAVTNLVIVDPAGKIPADPLAVEVGIAAGMVQKKLNLQSLTLGLAPTAKAKNVLTASGTLDFTDTNALTAKLTVKSDALDLTPYYDQFAGGAAKPAAAPGESAPATTPPAADPNAEPPPITLPIKDSRIDVQIAKLILREIEVSDIAISTVVDRQTVAINPLRMAVNGGPVNGSVALNLGVPGYQYDIQLKADQVPIRPALLSFSPTFGGTSRGEVVADVKVKGTGQTGRNLRQFLNGHVGFYLTNAMLTIVPDQTPQPTGTGIGGAFRSIGREFASGVLKAIATLLRIPDLTSSPVTHLATQVDMGQGAIVLRNADVKSAMFMVHAAGNIPIAEVLTNSPLSIPVDMWLSQKAAASLTLTGGNEPYTKLPRFVEMQGTLGAPQTKINQLALIGVIAGSPLGIGKKLGLDLGKTAEGILKQGGGEAGGLLKGIGGLLGGGTTKTNSTTTNAPPSKNPFQLFKLNP